MKYRTLTSISLTDKNIHLPDKHTLSAKEVKAVGSETIKHFVKIRLLEEIDGHNQSVSSSNSPDKSK